MTIVSALVPRRFDIPPAEARLFQVDPESRLLAHCHWQPGKPKDAPVIVIVHGLEGSSDGNYVRGIAEKAFHRGFHVVRMKQRNCGGTEALTPTLYNSGMSADYRAVFEELSNADGFQQIFFAGYSMGGNLVTKMAGEFGSAVPKALRGVCAVCPALDLAACADALERADNYLYQRRFVNGLMSRYARKHKMFPERYPVAGLPAVRTVRQFDDVITAPQFGFRDAQEFVVREAPCPDLGGRLDSRLCPFHPLLCPTPKPPRASPLLPLQTQSPTKSFFPPPLTTDS